MPSKTGTPNFTTLLKALIYYSPYSPGASTEDILSHVQAKITNGEIHIGPPNLNRGEKLIIDRNGRYHIIHTAGGE